MDDSEFIIALRNFVIIFIFYVAAIFGLVWLIGVVIAFLTNELHLIGYDLTALVIAYKWIKWLISVWPQLSYYEYNYLKIKLCSAIALPTLTTLTAYYIYLDEIKVWRPFKFKENVFGDARWATANDIKKAGLREKHGMLLGQDEDSYYVADGFQHALLFAPTGSGKGVGFVIPNLLFSTLR